MNHLENNNILCESQFAYRKSRGTDLAATTLIKDVLKGFEENKITIAIFLDLTKAFDCVNHRILKDKLQRYGIKGTAKRWFADYLSNRNQFVSFKGTNSLEKRINIGVPQGSILGPVLFLIYINDFCNIVQTGKQILFADDANYYETGSNFREVLDRVNRNLKLIVKWFRANKLSINLIKSESMLFTRRNMHFPLSPVLLDGKEISYNYSFKFLGIILDFKLNWISHIKRVQSKVNSACGILFQIRNKLTRQVARMVYMALAYPYLNYCNVLWASSHNSHLHSLFITQKKLIRRIMKKHRTEPSTPLFKKLNILKLKDVNNLNAGIFVFKSLHNLIPSPINYEYRLHGPYNLRTNNQLNIPFGRSNQYQRFIEIRGAKLWNDLPIETRSARTIFTFKKKLKFYYLNTYA